MFILQEWKLLYYDCFHLIGIHLINTLIKLRTFYRLLMF